MACKRHIPHTHAVRDIYPPYPHTSTTHTTDMKSRPTVSPSETENLNGTSHSETKTLTRLVRCLLISVSLQALAAFVFLSGIIFVTVWITEHVQLEAEKIDQIVDNGVHISDEVHTATLMGKRAIGTASTALNSTAGVLQHLANLLGSPTISLQLGDATMRG